MHIALFSRPACGARPCGMCTCKPLSEPREGDMKWSTLLLGATLLSCAKNSSVIVQEAPPDKGPLASYVQIALSLREDSGGIAANRGFYEKLGFTALEEGGQPV